jgi:hypothetical protein
MALRPGALALRRPWLAGVADPQRSRHFLPVQRFVGGFVCRDKRIFTVVYR